MSRKMVRTPLIFLSICIFVLLFLYKQASAENSKWRIYKRASIYCKTHGSLNFEYRPKNGIIIYFYIRNKNVSFKNNLPLYKVDDGKVHQLDTAQNIKTGKHHWIRWRLTKKNEVNSAELEEIMNGQKLYFQYFLPDNIIKEAIFDLTGIKKALNEIIH